MGALKALALAGLAFGASIGAASAADLLPPPPPMPEAPIAAPVDFGGWYLRGDAGVGINQQSGLRSTLLPFNAAGGPAPATADVFASIGDSALIGAGVGYQFNSWLRADMTGEYRGSAEIRRGLTYNAGGFPGYDGYHSSMRSGLFLWNAYADLGTWGGITPYVGAGVGLAALRWSQITDVGAGFGVSAPTSKTNFAWALMAGLGYNVTQNLKMDFGYRYVNMGQIVSNPIQCSQAIGCFNERHTMKLASHDIRLGFRYMFGDTPRMGAAPIMASAPGPLVRKY